MGYTEFDLRVADYLRGLRCNFRDYNEGTWDSASTEIKHEAERLFVHRQECEGHPLFDESVDVCAVATGAFLICSDSPDERVSRQITAAWPTTE